MPVRAGAFSYIDVPASIDASNIIISASEYESIIDAGIPYITSLSIAEIVQEIDKFSFLYGRIPDKWAIIVCRKVVFNALKKRLENNSVRLLYNELAETLSKLDRLQVIEPSDYYLKDKKTGDLTRHTKNGRSENTGKALDVLQDCYMCFWWYVKNYRDFREREDQSRNCIFPMPMTSKAPEFSLGWTNEPIPVKKDAVIYKTKDKNLGVSDLQNLSQSGVVADTEETEEITLVQFLYKSIGKIIDSFRGARANSKTTYVSLDNFWEDSFPYERKSYLLLDKRTAQRVSRSDGTVSLADTEWTYLVSEYLASKDAENTALTREEWDKVTHLLGLIDALKLTPIQKQVCLLYLAGNGESKIKEMTGKSDISNIRKAIQVKMIKANFPGTERWKVETGGKAGVRSRVVYKPIVFESDAIYTQEQKTPSDLSAGQIRVTFSSTGSVESKSTILPWSEQTTHIIIVPFCNTRENNSDTASYDAPISTYDAREFKKLPEHNPERDKRNCVRRFDKTLDDMRIGHVIWLYNSMIERYNLSGKLYKISKKTYQKESDIYLLLDASIEAGIVTNEMARELMEYRATRIVLS